jgi:hypothetical protein
VNLVDEQHVARLEIGQQRREVARALEHRPRGLAQVHLQLVGDDVRERGLAEARRPEDQHVIERLAAIARRLDEDIHLRLDVGLADVVGERLRAHRAIDDFVVAAAVPAMMRSGSMPMDLPFAAVFSARRIISVVDKPGLVGRLQQPRDLGRLVAERHQRREGLALRVAGRRERRRAPVPRTAARAS